jgi:hypothetical protein
MNKFLVIGAAALALAATMAVSGFAYTQAASAAPAAVSDWQGDAHGGGPGGRGGGGRLFSGLRTYMDTAVAEAFGMTPDELQALRDDGKTLTDVAIEQDLTVAEFDAKMEGAHTTALANAVKDGAITQAQADEIAARKAEPKGDPRGDQSDNPLHTYMESALAEAFGVSVDDLTQLRADGKTLKDLAIEQKLTVAEFQAKKDAARTNGLAAAVEAGVITQAQADAIAAHKDGKGGFGPGGPGGHRGPRGGFGGQP